MVAAALGWRVVDNELIEAVAIRAGLPPERVAEREERCATFVERLARTLAAASPDVFPPPESVVSVVDLPEADLVRITEAVVREIANRGRVVVVGRAAPAVLARQTDALHVRLVAPRPFRIQVAAARLSCTPAQAARMVDDTDRMRARYTQQYYRRDWNDAVNFHMVLNTGVLGFDGATDIIVARARGMGWDAGQADSRPGGQRDLAST